MTSVGSGEVDMESTKAPVTLVCGECGQTFSKPHEVLDHHTLVACPHCSTLQPAKLASDTSDTPPHAGMVKPSYRKGP